MQNEILLALDNKMKELVDVAEGNEPTAPKSPKSPKGGKSPKVVHKNREVTNVGEFIKVTTTRSEVRIL